jgi:two-component system KDP operon response regulator KdpE
MSQPARILLVDVEVSIQRAVAPLLRSRGYDVDIAATGAEATRLAAAHRPDLVILDLGLPDMDGVEVCRRLRALGTMPILVLSARDREADKVAALDAGGDDYVTKPFGVEELVARIRASLRRSLADAPTQSGQVQVGDLLIDYDRRRVRRRDDEVRLTPKEFELLSLLARQPGRVLTHRALLSAIWGGYAVDQPEHLWVLVSQLRKKLESDPAQPRYILSEPWTGYRLHPGDDS